MGRAHRSRKFRVATVRRARERMPATSGDLFRRGCLAVVLCVVAIWPPGSALHAAELDLRPTSSRAARRNATEAIPLAKFSPDDRRTIESIVENASLYRRLPTKVVRCDPRLFSLFMQHPQAIVNIWEVMGISKVRMQPLGQGSFRATDGNGTQGTIRMLECQCDDSAQNRAVVLASGTYQGVGVTGQVRADCIVVIRSGSVQDQDGVAFVTARIDVFIYLGQAGVELIARTFQPLLVRVADRNFEQTMDFISSFSDAAAKNPRGVERLASRLEQLSPDVQRRIAAIAYGMAQESAANTTSSTESHDRSIGGRFSPIRQADTRAHESGF